MRDNYAAEIKTLTQHLGTHKESMVFARLADRYLQLNETAKALEICQNGLRNHPHYDSAHYVLAKCFIALNQYEEAEKHLKHLIFSDPRFLNAHRLYAELMGRMGMTTRERASLLRIRDLDPLFSGVTPEMEPGASPEPPAVALPVDASVAAAPAPVTPTAAIVPPEPETAAAPTVAPESAWDAGARQPAAPEAPLAGPEPAAVPLGEYKPPVPEMDLDEFARELAALDVPEGEMTLEAGSGPQEIQPLAESAADRTSPESDFEREEIHFSEMLDDLFSLSRDEEDRRALEDRHSIERAARQPEPELGPPAPAAEVVAAPAPLRDFKPYFPEPPLATPPQAPAEPAGAAFPEEPEMSPVLPFRGDEEWQEDNRFAEAPEPETPVRLEPPTVESEPFEEEETEVPLASATGPEQEDDLGKAFLDEEEQEEQFSDFLANLDRLGGAVFGNEAEEPTQPGREKQFPIPWDEEPEEPPAVEMPPRREPLESSTPPPGAESPDETPAAADKPKEKFVTPTLGEIYAAQGQYAKAINVFEMLLKKNPENEWYRTKLDYLRKRLEDEKI